MANNTTINKNSDEKINNLFNNMQEALEVASSVDNTTASNLANQTHNLQAQWNQSTNAKNTASQNKNKENIAAPNNVQNNRTTLIEKILNLCSKIINFLTRIKKHFKTKVDNILTSLKEGMQYCSQLLLGKSNYQSNSINNAQQNNAVSPPLPPPSVSTRSVDDTKSQKITSIPFHEEIKNASERMSSTKSSSLNVPSKDDHQTMLQNALMRRRKGIAPEEQDNYNEPEKKSPPERLDETIDKHDINSAQQNNAVSPPSPPPPPPLPPKPLLGKSNYQSNSINNAQQNNAVSPPPPPPSVSTRSVDNTKSQKITSIPSPEEIIQARSRLRKSKNNEHLAANADVLNKDDHQTMLQNALEHRQKGTEEQDPTSLADALRNAIDKHNSNDSSMEMKPTVEEWDTSDEQDIQEPNQQLSENKISKGQDPQKRPIVDILTNNKKQKSYTERENEKKALNESNQGIKGRS